MGERSAQEKLSPTTFTGLRWARHAVRVLGQNRGQLLRDEAFAILYCRKQWTAVGAAERGGKHVVLRVFRQCEFYRGYRADKI